jgi:hypothetical protein
MPPIPTTCKRSNGAAHGEQRPPDEAPLQALYKLLAEATGWGWHQVRGREVVCTPVGGHYEHVAYWVLALNGSPPRGTILYPARRDIGGPAFLINQQSARRLGEQQQDVVEEFVRTYLPAPTDGLGGWLLDKARVVIVGGDPGEVCPRGLGITARAVGQ